MLLLSSTCRHAQNCRDCNMADPKTDVIKVSMGIFAPKGKENAEPSLEVSTFQAALKERYAREVQVQEQEELQRKLNEKRRQADAELQQRKEELRARQRRLLEEEERRRRAEEEAQRKAEEVLRLEEEEALRIEQELRDAEHRRLEELEAERLKQVQAAEDQEKVRAFCKAHGYTGVDCRRQRLWKFKFPLHSAVKANDAEMVELLLTARADACAKNSAGQTPMQLAQRSNIEGSSDAVLEVLQAQL
mmetsp:Transcript_41634/g.77594  ORF Transcript_41634/g.77594 Transcript_41634/m.77594 type:complete len:247 (+) Transcript_41634:88-828(+)